MENGLLELLKTDGNDVLKWETQIAAQGNLFTALYQLLRDNTPNKLEVLKKADSILKRWWDEDKEQNKKRGNFTLIEDGDKKKFAYLIEQWEHVRLLLECAKYLVNGNLQDIREMQWDSPAETLADLPGITFLKNLSPSQLREAPTWIKALAGVPSLSRPVQAFFATAEPLNPEKSYLNILEVEVFDYGFGYLGSHPGHCCAKVFTGLEAITALELAWNMAKADLIKSNPEVSRYGAFWRIFNDTNDPLNAPFDGASLGGAALRAFHYALQKKVPDREVLVLMTITKKGANDATLLPVLNVEAKTRAAIASRQIDTIIVLKANEKEKIEPDNKKEEPSNNEAEALATIQEMGATDHIRVIALQA